MQETGKGFKSKQPVLQCIYYSSNSVFYYSLYCATAGYKCIKYAQLCSILWYWKVFFITAMLPQILKVTLDLFLLWHKDTMKLIGNRKKSYKIQISFYHWNKNDFSMTLLRSVLIFNFYYYCALPTYDSRSAQFSERSEVKYRFTLPTTAKKEGLGVYIERLNTGKKLSWHHFYFFFSSFGIILLIITGED